MPWWRLGPAKYSTSTAPADIAPLATVTSTDDDACREPLRPVRLEPLEPLDRRDAVVAAASWDGCGSSNGSTGAGSSVGVSAGTSTTGGGSCCSSSIGGKGAPAIMGMDRALQAMPFDPPSLAQRASSIQAPPAGRPVVAPRRLSPLEASPSRFTLRSEWPHIVVPDKDVAAYHSWCFDVEEALVEAFRDARSPGRFLEPCRDGPSSNEVRELGMPWAFNDLVAGHQNSEKSFDEWCLQMQDCRKAKEQQAVDFNT